METPAYLLALAGFVTVLVDGAVVPSAPQARLVANRVVAPLALLAHLAERVDIGAGRVSAVRGERACSAPLLEGDSGVASVALGPLARCLGAEVSWNGRSRTLGLSFAAPVVPLRTHPPFDPGAPQAVPTTVFTPEPAPPTPRAIATGAPLPRRTAIPATPSLPLPSRPPR